MRSNAPKAQRSMSLWMTSEQGTRALSAAGAPGTNRLRPRSWVLPASLAILILLLYVPSVRFVPIWDDPNWYKQGEGYPWFQILVALPSYQFYRPLAILLNRALLSAQGTLHTAVAHGLQIGAHLAATLLGLAVLPELGFKRRQTQVAALLYAVHPFSYQAVAWQAPQQPLAMTLVLLALWLACRYRRGRRAGWLALSLLAFLLGLLFQESVLPFLWLFLWLALRDDREGRRPLRGAWALLYLLLALGYVAVWLHVPRQQGIVGRGFQPKVLVYLLQGVVFPLAHGLAGAATHWTLAALGGLLAGGWLLLLAGLVAAGEGRAAWMSLALILLGLAPVWMGLPWPYVEIGPRLLYPATWGIAALWAGWGAWALERERPCVWRGVGALALALALAISLRQWHQFQQLYRRGTQHLAQAVTVMSQRAQERLLFINFPDRLALRPAPYPLGFWGLTLAPVIQDLADYALLTTGRSAATRSLASFATGWAERERWAYRVDLRGENAGPERIWAEAQWADGVYLTHYRPDGSLALQEVGAVVADDGRPALATFGGKVQLVQGQVAGEGQHLRLSLTWRLQGQAEIEDTFFVHLLTREGDYVAGQDGDALGGLLPLWAWQQGWLVRDARGLSLPSLAPGDYALTVGLYHRGRGQRYEALRPDGAAAYAGEFQIATLRVTAPGVAQIVPVAGLAGP